MSTAKFDTLSTLDGSQSVPVNTVAQGSAKAWVNFNGTGTVAIRSAFNVTSITDGGTGIYTVNFTNAMSDTNYATVASGSTGVYIGISAFTTGGVSLVCRTDAAGSTDTNPGNVAIFR